MGCTHTFSIHALSNPSTLSFDNAQIENSLAASTPSLRTTEKTEERFFCEAGFLWISSILSF